MPKSLGIESQLASVINVQERQGVPARCGDPARGIPTPEPGPLSSQDPWPLALSQAGRKGGGGGSGRKGAGPSSKRGRGPGSWCSSACTGSRSVGIPRAGSPQWAGTPSHFPKCEPIAI